MAETQPQWWQNAQTIQSTDPFLNPSQVDQRGQNIQGRLGFGQLDLENRMFEEQVRQRNEVLAKFEGAFGQDGGFNVPSEFASNVALFQPGGQFGAGAKMEIERGGQQAIAAGQTGFARTGMSSGTNVAGLQARVLADTAMSKAKVEGQRVQELSGSLRFAGEADLATQQLRAQREAEMLRTLSSFG